MSQMSVEFSFDDEKLKQKGIKKDDIYFTLKKQFEAMGLVCVSDGGILAFESTDPKDHYIKSWFTILPMVDCDWFSECASRCVIVKDDVEYEVLKNIPRSKEIMEYCTTIGGMSAKYA